MTVSELFSFALAVLEYFDLTTIITACFIVVIAGVAVGTLIRALRE